MQMYALATIPLIKNLNDNITQIWYADDACATGKIARLRRWWNLLSTEGAKFSYFVNPTKSWLITKPEHLSSANTSFADSGVQITSDGRPYLGAPIGSPAFMESYVSDKVSLWVRELELLTTIAHSQPHAVYAALTHGLTSRWTFLMRKTPDIGHLFQPLEDIIRRKLIPSITGQSPPNDLVRDLLALPSRLGGIALANPIVISAAEFSSCQICGPLKLAILNCNFEYSEEISSEQLIAKKSVYKSKQAILSDIADSLKRPCLPLYGEQWTLLRKRSL